MTGFLDQLLRDAHDRVAHARSALALAALRDRATATAPPPSFRAALARPGVSVIAEIKRASPSRGDLALGIDAGEQARRYAAAGAAAISVLTEPARFKGDLGDLRAAAATGVACLRKDFVVDEYQIWEARLAGASAVLLIVAALSDEDLGALHEAAGRAGLDVLVEVHDERELERATTVRADIVGVNARDLRTFDVDRSAFERLRPGFPAGVLAVAESGIRGPEDVREAARLGADAVLVGESLVTAADPAAATAALVAAGRPEPASA